MILINFAHTSSLHFRFVNLNFYTRPIFIPEWGTLFSCESCSSPRISLESKAHSQESGWICRFLCYNPTPVLQWAESFFIRRNQYCEKEDQKKEERKKEKNREQKGLKVVKPRHALFRKKREISLQHWQERQWTRCLRL